ncbi:MAG: 50S ribosomal protein L20 [Armatimonadota bacterium]|nr:50S ribosomal protein L20 [Armatimonadota bacterium]
MARVKRGMTASAKHKKIRDLAKGYYGAKHRWFRTANEAVMHAGQYAYRDRRNKRRELRRLWIVRINAAARQNGLSYSRLINGLLKAGVEIDRKVLSDLAVTDATAFAQIAEIAKGALAEPEVAEAQAA